MSCPSCHHPDGMIGFSHISCPNKSCIYFDETCSLFLIETKETNIHTIDNNLFHCIVKVYLASPRGPYVGYESACQPGVIYSGINGGWGENKECVECEDCKANFPPEWRGSNNENLDLIQLPIGNLHIIQNWEEEN